MSVSERKANAMLWERARRVLPGGVNSPVRAFRAVGGVPPFIASARGSRLTDAEGREYVDYVGSWGPLILGHAHPAVVEAVRDAAARGTSYGAPTEAEVRLGELICSAFPSVELVRLVNSGTEATMSAVRLARAFTGRHKIVKFDGCYHGHSDSLLVAAGSGLLTLGISASPGVPESLARETLSLPFNQPALLQEAFERYGKEIAAVILEPVPANMGVVPPAPGFLEKVIQLCRQGGSLVIFDEVITGFRLALGGAQEIFSLEADLTCLGKVLGGGLPIGAYGGRREIMSLVAPEGPVYQAGTLSGNPIAVAAGLKTLELLAEEKPYGELERFTRRLCQGLAELAREMGVVCRVSQVGSLFTLFFRAEPVTDFQSAQASDTGLFARFFRGMLEEGIYLAPSQFEAGFVSTAHSEEDLERTLEAARKTFARLRAEPSD